MIGAPSHTVAKRGFRSQMKELRGRPDSEHEMSFNRVAFLVAILICVLFGNPNPSAVGLLVGYTLFSVGMFLHIVRDAGASEWRRLLMMATDILFMSVVMYANGAYAAAFYPVYLWVIFGNGFRFGLRHLFIASAMSVLGFGGVIWMTPFWRGVPALSIGLLLALVILPAYTGQLIRKISRARQEAEEASRAKSYFLASVSHELRTPLTAIIGLGAQLEGSRIGVEQRQMARTIMIAGRTLLSQINQLLDFSRLGAGGLQSERREFSLPALLLNVRDVMRVAAEEKKLGIRFHVDADTPSLMSGDEDRLRDVLINLTANAVKFTAAGHIAIAARIVHGLSGRTMLHLTVSDTGIGIEESAQQHIFESFRQADNTIIDRFGGTGLGLAICRQISRHLGGEIGVESTLGEGSRFWFTAPVDLAAQEAVATTEPVAVVLLTSDDELAERLPDWLACRVATTVENAERLAVRDDLPILVDRKAIAATGMPADALAARLDIACAPILLHADAAAADQPIYPDAGPATGTDRISGFVTDLAAGFTETQFNRARDIAERFGNRAVSGPASEAFKPRRPLEILVADDNQTNQKVFGLILTNAGHRVQSAFDGEAALDLLRDRAVDVVLMDVNMPVMNGIEATKLFRFASLGHRRVPIIGITADASSETAERCIEAGMDACVVKPVEPLALLRLVDEIADGAAPQAPVYDPRGVVTPLFPDRRDLPDAIDPAVLAEFMALGGRDFVVELMADYVADTRTLLAALHQSVADRDAEAFRAGSHALKSSASNVGATMLSDMCGDFQHINDADFSARGPQHLEALETEITRIAQALDGDVAKTAGGLH